LQGKSELEFYVEMYLLKRDSSIKRYLLELISKYGNIAHSALMVKRLKSVLSKKRTKNWFYVSGQEAEIVTIIRFLQLSWICSEKMESLNESEKSWIKERMKNPI